MTDYTSFWTRKKADGWALTKAHGERREFKQVRKWKESGQRRPGLGLRAHSFFFQKVQKRPPEAPKLRICWYVQSTGQGLCKHRGRRYRCRNPVSCRPRLMVETRTRLLPGKHPGSTLHSRARSRAEKPTAYEVTVWHPFNNGSCIATARTAQAAELASLQKRHLHRTHLSKAITKTTDWEFYPPASTQLMPQHARLLSASPPRVPELLANDPCTLQTRHAKPTSGLT